MPGTDIYFILLDRLGWGGPFIISKKSILYGISVAVWNKWDCHRASRLSGLSGL